MTDEKLVQNGADEACHVSRGPGTAAEPHDEKNDDGRALVGKIARLPAGVRDEINTHLYNGKSGPEILSWLNDLPAVKEILAAQFDGAPIKHQNLSNWRATGYLRWLAEKKNVSAMKDLAKYAADMANASGGGISRGVAAVASGKILEFLETPYEKTTPENLVKLANASARLCRSDQNAVRLNIAYERLRQQERHLLLMRDKHQRDRVAVALHVLGDARAKEIEASDHDYAEKIELLGLHLFGDLWEPRQFPAETTIASG